MAVEVGLATSLTRGQWDELAQKLREPFDPKDVDFRVQGRANEQTGRAQVVAYIDARAVQDRLDAVVGAGNWSFDWTPLVIDKGEVMVAKGTLTIYGISKSDAGSASNFEQSLGAVSHCFKRSAVHWGIGRYLYNLPAAWVSVERGGKIPEAVLRDLRARLPRPEGQPAQTEVLKEEVADAPVERKRSTPSRAPAPARATTAPQPAAEAPQPLPATSTASRPQATGPQTSGAQANASQEQPATEQQLISIRKLCAALGKPEPEPGLTYHQARTLITQLSGEYQRARRAS